MRLQIGVIREISALLPEREIRDRNERADAFFRKRLELRSRIDCDGDREADGDRHGESRKESANSSSVEFAEVEAIRENVAFDQSTDEVATQDEKEIDADVAAREAGPFDVIEDHDRHGQPTQAVEVASVVRIVDGRVGRRTTRPRRAGLRSHGGRRSHSERSGNFAPERERKP